MEEVKFMSYFYQLITHVKLLSCYSTVKDTIIIDHKVVIETNLISIDMENLIGFPVSLTERTLNSSWIF